MLLRIFFLSEVAEAVGRKREEDVNSRQQYSLIYNAREEVISDPMGRFRRTKLGQNRCYGAVLEFS